MTPLGLAAGVFSCPPGAGPERQRTGLTSAGRHPSRR